MRTMLDDLRADIDELRTQNVKLTHDLRVCRGSLAWATRRANIAEAAVLDLNEENVALRGLSAHPEASAGENDLPDDDPVPNDDVLDAPTILGLVRVQRYLKRLYETDDETNCRMANDALRYIADLVAEMERVRPELRDKRRTA